MAGRPSRTLTILRIFTAVIVRIAQARESAFGVVIHAGQVGKTEESAATRTKLPITRLTARLMTYVGLSAAGQDSGWERPNEYCHMLEVNGP
jgi:hypothetical protein